GAARMSSPISYAPLRDCWAAPYNPCIYPPQDMSSMRPRFVVVSLVIAAVAVGLGVRYCSEDAAAQTGKKDAAVAKSDAIEKVIAPFIAKHCVECHGPKKKSAGLALHIYTDEKSILKDRRKWHDVVRMLTNGEMPPPDKKARPDLKDVEAVLKSVNDV